MSETRVPDTRRYFFLHVMKTGGTTFWMRSRANFTPEEIFPSRQYESDSFDKIAVAYLAQLPAERTEQVRYYSGHYPLVARELLGSDLVTMTILRDPIARTISCLKHAKRDHPAYESLEAIYEHPFVFEALIHNHQTKLFALTWDDDPRDCMQFLDIDQQRLETAKERLRSLETFGLTECHDEFVAEVTRRFGWSFGTVANKQVSDDRSEISKSLRARIVEDNAMDLEFYEYARELYAERRRES